MANRMLARVPRGLKPKQHTKQRGVCFISGNPLITAKRVRLARLDPDKPKERSFSFVSAVVNTCGLDPFVATDGLFYRRI